jgi:hypothetical protein
VTGNGLGKRGFSVETGFFFLLYLLQSVTNPHPASLEPVLITAPSAEVWNLVLVPVLNGVRIREFPGPTLNLKTGYTDRISRYFLRFLRAYSGIVP